MPRKDAYHESVKTALEKEGWTITDDPLNLSMEEVILLADLGAERVISAEKGTQKIAIEIKTFSGESPVTDFHNALGQYQNYEVALAVLEPDRFIYLAVPQDVWTDFFQRLFVQRVIRTKSLKILVYEPQTSTITQWIN